MKYTNRADLLIAAGESIKMQEKAGIEPVCKLGCTVDSIDNLVFDCGLENYEFPLAVVPDETGKGKPVFIGDELYCEGVERRVKFRAGDYIGDSSRWSWNPPKPKTLLVELPWAIAEIYVESYKDSAFTDGMIARAIGKAIEKEQQK